MRLRNRADWKRSGFCLSSNFKFVELTDLSRVKECGTELHDDTYTALRSYLAL